MSALGLVEACLLLVGPFVVILMFAFRFEVRYELRHVFRDRGNKGVLLTC